MQKSKVLDLVCVFFAIVALLFVFAAPSFAQQCNVPQQTLSSAAVLQQQASANQLQLQALPTAPRVATATATAGGNQQFLAVQQQPQFLLAAPVAAPRVATATATSSTAVPPPVALQTVQAVPVAAVPVSATACNRQRSGIFSGGRPRTRSVAISRSVSRS
jgi:hypothetical protein